MLTFKDKENNIMKKLLSVFLLILMICLALPVSVKAWDSNNCPWKDYNNYLFYNNTNQEKKSGFVTECILIKFDPDYVSSTTITVSDFFELAPLIDYFVYNKDSGYFYVYLKEPDFGLDENGYPIYTKEWIDQVISGMQSVANLTYSLDYMPVTAELLEELKLDRTLYFGCKGNDVKEAQKYLRAYGYLTATPDGSFGAMSEAATIMFQAYNGLEKPDGRIGKWTLGKINGDDSYYFSPIFRGIKGTPVKVIQTYLKKLGYLSANPDGSFGSLTEAAVKLFQSDNDFPETGVADIQTLSALFNRNTKNRSYYVRTLKYGDRGNDVKKLQIMLLMLGYLTATPDGIYGAKTEAAVIAFQAFNGLENPDGKVGNWTRTKLNVNPVPFSAIKIGSRGTAVLVLQKYLAKLDYLKTMNFTSWPATYNDVIPDGSFGGITDGVVKIFQYNNDLRWDGVVTIETYTAIVSRTAKPRVLDGKAVILPDLFLYDNLH